MARRLTLFLVLALALFSALAMTPAPAVAGEEEDAAKAESAVRDFEERIEQIATELTSIRRDLEKLTREMVEGETGRIFVFLKGKVSDWSDRSVELRVDEEVVMARPLTAAELDVMSRDLPLEILDIRLPAGEHTISIAGGGEAVPPPVPMKVVRATMASWVAEWESGSVRWREE